MNNNNVRTFYSHEAEMRVQREKATLTLLFLLVGLGIGTALALLFAPQGGKDTRDDLASGAREAMHSGRETVEPTLKRLEREFADLRKSVENRVNDLR